ncbi:MAG: L-threonylcarbamoyladenylate synthase [Treponema sp.]|nr:L-threonylcarbamoyladenylate synthase [Treponema sp.]MCL2238147.1 L-threonylcarbamoyladenylate synthase [Treponema sp.]
MNVLPVSQESIQKGAKIIKSGGLVAFPTETVYGLGADAFNPMALAKVFEVKGRPRFDPLIVHIAAIETLEKVADLSRLSDDTRKKLFLLAQKFWPGPLSIILPKNEKIPDLATAGLSTAAIRFPDNEAAQKLIALSTGAVAAPSANPFGALSPTKAEHVRQGLGEKVDLILDGGAARIGVESTVLDISGESIKILRPGGTPREAIEEILQVSVDREHGADKSEYELLSPGMLKSHYAPHASLSVHTDKEIVQIPNEGSSCAFLFFDDKTKDEWFIKQNQKNALIFKVLSKTGNLTEAASNLFEMLHEIDESGAEKIFAQEAPNHGIGEAINDRLRRGAN